MRRSLGILMFVLVSWPIYSGIVIKTTLTIGKKNSACDGFGFCTMSNSSSYTEGAINGTFTLNDQKGAIIIEIFEKDIREHQPDKMVYFINQTSVEFSESFSIPSDILNEAGIRMPLVIRKGSYDLRYARGKFIVEIPL